MDLLLTATEGFQNIDSYENKAEQLLRTWLGTFAGWGLLSSMMPSNFQYYFISQMNHTRQNWTRADTFSYEKAFEGVVSRYELDGKNKLDDLIPDFGVSIDEMVEENNNERKKIVTVYFDAKWKLEVKFTIEKKKVVNNLLDAAAEVVGKHLRGENNVTVLEIPVVLRGNVVEKV